MIRIVPLALVLAAAAVWALSVPALVHRGAASASTAALRSAPATGAARSPLTRLRAVPVVRQRLRNNCETAALSMILAARGIRRDQLGLQGELTRSGPLDPVPGAAGGLATWGDPDRGFVGRAEGGGAWGGYGVYQGPVRRLAARYGVRLVDLSRTRPAVIYRRLAAGRPVLAWIGLSAGPYRRWRTPSGREIGVNLGEHTVVLTGLSGSGVALNDPLVGVKRVWTRAEFEWRWSLLGRRALGL